MNVSRLTGVAGVLALALAGCATVPSGPRVMAMPGPNKSFEQFQADQGSCQQYASASIGGRTAEENAQQSAVGSAAVGTMIGAAAGAILGAATGNAGAGAAWGAGTGLLFGSAAGANAAGYSYADSQRRYDMAYSQCMYARGNDLPGRVASRPAPPQASYPPPNYPAPNLSGGAPRSSQTQPAYTTYGTPPGPIAPGPAVPAPSAPPSTYPPPNTPAPPGIT
ncbi:MAG: glycine zipper family protein [Burkholderiales bacterium]